MWWCPVFRTVLIIFFKKIVIYRRVITNSRFFGILNILSEIKLISSEWQRFVFYHFCAEKSKFVGKMWFSVACKTVGFGFNGNYANIFVLLSMVWAATRRSPWDQEEPKAKPPYTICWLVDHLSPGRCYSIILM
jgi:hypothetical protein